jgi:hypothetical protein
MTLLLHLWTLGLTTLQICAYATMQRRHRPHSSVAGEWKSILELSDAMYGCLEPLKTEEGSVNGREGTAREVDEDVIERRIKGELKGGAIAYECPVLPEGEEPWTVRAWVRREIVWLCGVLGALAMQIYVIVKLVGDPHSRTDLIFFLPLPLALGFAMYVGSTQGSRLMVLLWAVVVVCAVPAVVIGIVLRMLMSGY